MSNTSYSSFHGEKVVSKTPLWHSGLHTLGTSIISILLGIALSIVIARVLGPSGKGSYDLVLATIAMLGMVLGLSLPSGITYVAAHGQTALLPLSLRLLPIALLQGILSAALLMVLWSTNYLSALLPPAMGNRVIIVVSVSLVLGALTSYGRAWLVGRQEIIRANQVDMLGRILSLALLLVWVSVTTVSRHQVAAIEIVWINVIVMILTSLLFVRALLPSLDPANDGPGGLRTVLAFASPCYLGNLAQFLNYRLDVFIVSFFVGIEGVGLYTLAVSLAQLIWLVSNAAATVLLPRVASLQQPWAETALQTARITRLVFDVSVLLAILIALLAQPLLPLVYGQAFQRSTGALLLLLPGIAIFSIVNVLASYLAGVGNPQLNVVVALAGLAITLVLDFGLIPRLGITGAAIASTVSYTASTILTIGFFIQKTHLRVAEVLLITPQDVSMVGSLLRMIYQRINSG
jgi:O-antigen/teichoic acid export membrane protein